MVVAGGVIVSVGADPAGHPPSSQVLDLRGYLLLPSLVEPHAHLRATGVATGPTDITTLARSRAARYLAAGTTAIRVHVDVGRESGLRAFGELLEVRAGLAGILDIQIVATVSDPLTGMAGATSRSLLERALAAGADLAGSGPGLGDETGRTVEALAVLAASAATGLDLHMGETADLAPGPLGRLVAIARAGFGYPLTVSHVASLGAKRKERGAQRGRWRPPESAWWSCRGQRHPGPATPPPRTLAPRRSCGNCWKQECRPRRAVTARTSHPARQNTRIRWERPRTAWRRA